jgi:transposase
MQQTAKISQKSKQQSQRPSPKPGRCNQLPKTLSEKEFNKFFLPHLSLPKQSRKPVIPLWRVFNYILYQLDTDCQWSEVPIKDNPTTGKKEICSTSIWRWFNRWSGDGSFEKAFINRKDCYRSLVIRYDRKSAPKPQS